MIYKLFSDNLRLNADAKAIVTSTGEVFSFAESNKRINQWANYFIDQGIKAGDRVAVLLKNEDHHVFIFSALDKINAVYVPFDSDIPKLQLNTDITSLNLKKFIIEDPLDTQYEIPQELKISLSSAKFTAIFSSNDKEPSRVYNANGLEKIAYIMSSSGSTGDKKWMELFGAGLEYWAEVERNLFAPYPLERVLVTRSPAYDARISEYVRAFGSGAELHLLNSAERQNFTSILDACKSKTISCVLLIASQLDAENSERIISALKSYGIKHIMVTGDTCTLLLKELCERYKINLWNCYGPTEATFGMSVLRVNDLQVTNALGDVVVPIGKPHCGKVRYHLIEDKLYIESPYLTPGYLKPEDNAANFIYVDSEQGRIKLFDTGDVFSETPKGDFLLFEGRRDAKLSGVKVTPLSIENCIRKFKNEKACVGYSIDTAVVVKKILEQHKLFAYVVIQPPFTNQEAEAAFKIAFRTYLKDSLINAQIPIIIPIEIIPRLTTSQKINKRELISRQDPPESYFFNAEWTREESKRDSSQTTLCLKQIWREVLKFKADTQISNETDFVFLGGDSIRVVAMLKKINEQLDPSYNYQTLLDLSTITINSITESLFKKKEHSKNEAFIKPLIFLGKDKKNIFFLPDLLGAAYFGYFTLAKQMAKQFDCNIYGLIDPGTTDAALLPESLEHEVVRYRKAIERVQPEGLYQLAGFSYGTIPVHKLVEQFQIKHKGVSAIHLFDGHPPALYQALPNKAHFDLLQTLINFIVTTFNNDYYAEQLEPIELNDYSTHNKLEQVELSFNELEKKLKNSVSKLTLNMAKRNLNFALTAKTTQHILPGCLPTLYLTNSQQDYHQVINKIPGLSNASSDRNYYFWGHYFNLTRCSVELPGNHLSVLHSTDEASADCYWRRTKSLVANPDFARHGPGPQSFYQLTALNPILNSDYQLSIFFMNRRRTHKLADNLTEMRLSPIIVEYDQNLQKTSEGQDTICTIGTNLFCYIPQALTPQVKKLMKEHEWPFKCKYQEPSSKTNQIFKLLECSPAQTGSIDLSIFLKEQVYLTLSFKYNTDGFITTLQEQLGQSLIIFSQDKNNIIYHYTLTEDGNYDSALTQASDFLAAFITIIAPYTSTSSRSLDDIISKQNIVRRISTKAYNKMTISLKTMAALEENERPPELNKWLAGYREADKLVKNLYQMECALMIWKKIKKDLFDEFALLYPDITPMEFNELINPYKSGISDSEIDNFFKQCLEKNTQLHPQAKMPRSGSLGFFNASEPIAPSESGCHSQP